MNREGCERRAAPAAATSARACAWRAGGTRSPYSSHSSVPSSSSVDASAKARPTAVGRAAQSSAAEESRFAKGSASLVSRRSSADGFQKRNEKKTRCRVPCCRASPSPRLPTTLRRDGAAQAPGHDACHPVRRRARRPALDPAAVAAGPLAARHPCGQAGRAAGARIPSPFQHRESATGRGVGGGGAVVGGRRVRPGHRRSVDPPERRGARRSAAGRGRGGGAVLHRWRRGDAGRAGPAALARGAIGTHLHR
eukprot:scaffold5998_cov69-Isochrysis_galbana.AAC.2